MSPILTRTIAEGGYYCELHQLSCDGDHVN